MTISHTHKHPNGDRDITYYIYEKDKETRLKKLGPSLNNTGSNVDISRVQRNVEFYSR